MMPRGRKPDLSIPQTRSLTNQRAYRARKAQYIADLEHRCALMEEENRRLREEIATARTEGAQQAFASETAEASADLVRHLATASASIQRLQGLIFPAPSAVDTHPPTVSIRYYPGVPPSTSSSTSSSDDSTSERFTLSPPHPFRFSPRYEARIPRTTASPVPFLQKVDSGIIKSGSARLSISRLVDDGREPGSPPPLAPPLPPLAPPTYYASHWSPRPSERLRSDSLTSPPRSAARPTFFDAGRVASAETTSALRGPGMSGGSFPREQR